MPADHLTDGWFHAAIRFNDWNSAERTVATVIAPALNDLLGSDISAGWWFMRKYPCWRIRVRGASTATLRDLLAKLEADEVIAGWQPGIYEPETHAFGGPAGMDIAHRQFCADTRGVLAYARLDNPPIGRRELSVPQINAMLAAAGLDWFERGDVFARVAAMRPAPPDGTEPKLAQLTDQVRTLATIPAEAVISTGTLASFGASWLAAFEDTGLQLSQAARCDDLTRGIHAILVHVMIFHWNRLGLSAATQGILARAARDAFLPLD
jgi:thiopeptide-type bacteriocin biosynthesis protein